ncbi:methyltransferase, FkbM family [Salinihabitans flavidus]|uniref:Methyltransferase, FkbM family n=1 Tax=Salinihabitans flavidus TaxID=569882 RepID=A0A1H8TWS0_9RHOB|nr:FkbM family methyltransferase [Salinihabitans flavidus]SEO95034.1 methyltransferase, FkbM family [Salinihabitans flavidus]
MRQYTLNDVRLELPEWLQESAIADRLSRGAYEVHEARAVMQRVRAGMPVLELGAGLGYVTALCARLAGPENVVSVEANPKMIDVVRHNLSLNGADAVTLIHGAVSEGDLQSETLAFNAGALFWGGSILMSDTAREGAEEVPALRLGDLLMLHRPRFVIMDIEGAERFLFDRSWPPFVRFVVLELHPKRYPDSVVKKIVDCMSRSGLTYDPVTSTGRILGFRRVRDRGA